MFFNRATAAPKCIYIEGGVIKTSDGACGQTTNEGTAAVIVPASAPATIPGINQQVIDSGNQSTTTPTTTIPTATTTPEIIPIATSTPEIIIPPVETATTTP